MGRKGSELSEPHRAIIVHEVTTKRTPLGVISANSKRDLGRHLPKSTVHSVAKHALEAASQDNSHPLEPHNLASYKRSGAPRILSNHNIDQLIAHATKNKPQRLRGWTRIAAELNIKASRGTINSAFFSRGYGRYRVYKKPFLSEAMKEARLAWAIKHNEWPCGPQYPPNMGFNQVLFSDKTLGRMGEVKGKRRITRLADEGWLEDTTDKTFGGPRQGILFYGIIGFNWKGPCHVYRKETRQQREDPHAEDLEAARAEWTVKLRTGWSKGGSLVSKDAKRILNTRTSGRADVLQSRDYLRRPKGVRAKVLTPSDSIKKSPNQFFAPPLSNFNETDV